MMADESKQSAEAPPCEPARRVVRRPKRALPKGAIDCHFHIFGPSSCYPYAPERSYTPPDASLDEYEHLASVLGFSRAVIVQPSVYGLDNRRTLAALKESRLPMRAVVVLDPAISDNELAQLHQAGVRGVRINLLFKAGLALHTAITLADRIRDLGWHLQFLADVSQIEDLRGLMNQLALPVVFDHLGHVPSQKGVKDRGFQTLLSLLEEGRVWVKLSGAYRITSLAQPPYADLLPFVEELLQTDPGQLVWGTDWPHPAILHPMPDDTDLVDMPMDWLADDELRRRIFVDNAERLYDFG